MCQKCAIEKLLPSKPENIKYLLTFTIQKMYNGSERGYECIIDGMIKDDIISLKYDVVVVNFENLQKLASEFNSIYTSEINLTKILKEILGELNNNDTRDTLIQTIEFAKEEEEKLATMIEQGIITSKDDTKYDIDAAIAYSKKDIPSDAIFELLGMLKMLQVLENNSTFGNPFDMMFDSGIMGGNTDYRNPEDVKIAKDISKKVEESRDANNGAIVPEDIEARVKNIAKEYNLVIKCNGRAVIVTKLNS